MQRYATELGHDYSFLKIEKTVSKMAQALYYYNTDS